MLTMDILRELSVSEKAACEVVRLFAHLRLYCVYCVFIQNKHVLNV